MTSDPLARVRRAAVQRRRWDAEYRAALDAAHAALVEQQHPAPFAAIAAAAGISRQHARTLTAGRQ